MKILQKTIAVILAVLTLYAACAAAMPVFAANEDVHIVEAEEKNRT